MIKNSTPHFLSVIFLALLSLAFFYPLLIGKVIVQSDIQQFQGMQRQVLEHRADYDEEPYWADNAFGGMPTYQINSIYPYDFIGTLDKLIRFLPRPADYLFVYLLSFYLLILYFTPKFQIAIAGAIAFGFSTYLIIILGVGHNTKALAIGYMPLVVFGGVACVFNQTNPWFFHTHTGDGLANQCQSLSNDLLPLDTCGFNCTGIYDRIVPKAKISITD